jgi:hypothetical protein
VRITKDLVMKSTLLLFGENLDEVDSKILNVVGILMDFHGRLKKLRGMLCC